MTTTETTTRWHDLDDRAKYYALMRVAGRLARKLLTAEAEALADQWEHEEPYERWPQMAPWRDEAIRENHEAAICLRWLIEG